MSATQFIYATEEVRDAFGEQLDRAYGEEIVPIVEEYQPL